MPGGFNATADLAEKSDFPDQTDKVDHQRRTIVTQVRVENTHPGAKPRA
ncbi:hypothetical protein C4J89_0578 [Pseudomonas sp. R4-35-07]|nr:hypothetical protein C4J89_0578 [Pseudomonas sp. R4-35-07]